MGARDEEFFGRESGDDFVTFLRYDDLFLNAGRAPAVGGGPEGLQCKHHSGFDFLWMLERDKPADDGLLPDGEADAMAILQSESRFFVGESEVLRAGPDRGNLVCAPSRANEFDGRIEIVTATLVGIHHGKRSRTDHEGAVVTGAIPHIGVEDVV